MIPNTQVLLLRGLRRQGPLLLPQVQRQTHRAHPVLSAQVAVLRVQAVQRVSAHLRQHPHVRQVRPRLPQGVLQAQAALAAQGRLHLPRLQGDSHAAGARPAAQGPQEDARSLI